MKCIKCGLEEDKDVIYCRDCGTPFYYFENKEVFLYLSNKSKGKVTFHIINNGAKPIYVKKKYKVDSFPMFWNPIPNPITPGERRTLVVPLGNEQQINTQKIPVTFLGYINDSDDFIRKVTVNVLPIPDIHINPIHKNKTELAIAPEDKKYIVLSPTRGYIAQISMSLYNESVARINNIKINCGRLVDVNFPIILTPNENTILLDVELPPEEGGTEKDVVAIISFDGNLKDSKAKFLIKYYDSYKDLALKIERWTEKGLDPENELKKDETLKVFIPYNEKKIKHLSVIAKKTPNLKGRVDPMLLEKIDINIPKINAYELNKNKFPIFVEEINKPIDYLLPSLSELHSPDKNIEISIKNYSCIPTYKKTKKFPIEIATLKRKEYPGYIGIDFGTTNSCIALMIPKFNKVRGKWVFPRNYVPAVETLPLDVIPSESHDSSEIIPSVLDLKPKTWYGKIGRWAESGREPQKDSKRKLLYATSSNKRKSEKPIVIVKEIIKELVKRTQNYLEERGISVSMINNAVITVPTTFMPKESEKIKKACENAFTELGIINKKTDIQQIDESLAAIRYLLEKASGEQKKLIDNSDVIIIYDFGGGTTDVTAVLREEAQTTRYKAIVAGGNPKLGGLDVNEYLKEILKEYQIPFEEHEINTYKHKLQNEIMWKRTIPGKFYKKEQRKKIIDELHECLEKHIRNIFEDIFDELRENYNIQVNSLAILLAGGSSNLVGFNKLVKKVVSDLIQAKRFSFTLNGDVMIMEDPKRAVALGAFLYKAWGQEKFASQNVLPYRVLWPLDRNTDTSMIKRKIRQIEFKDGTKGKFAEIVPRGTPFPIEIQVPASDLGVKQEINNPAFYYQLGAGEITPNEVWDFYKKIEPTSILKIKINKDKRIDLSVV